MPAMAPRSSASLAAAETPSRGVMSPTEASARSCTSAMATARAPSSPSASAPTIASSATRWLWSATLSTASTPHWIQPDRTVTFSRPAAVAKSSTAEASCTSGAGRRRRIPAIGPGVLAGPERWGPRGADSAARFRHRRVFEGNRCFWAKQGFQARRLRRGDVSSRMASTACQSCAANTR